MSVCHTCPYKVRHTNDDGDCVLTPKWQKKFEANTPWEDWPCVECELVDMSAWGQDKPYRKGATFISLDNLSKGDGTDFEAMAFGDSDLDDVYIPISYMNQAMAITRGLPPIQRDAVESRFYNDKVCANTLALKYGVKPEKVRAEFRKAVLESPTLNSIFNLKGKRARSINMCVALDMREHYKKQRKGLYEHHKSRIQRNAGNGF